MSPELLHDKQIYLRTGSPVNSVFAAKFGVLVSFATHNLSWPSMSQSLSNEGPLVYVTDQRSFWTTRHLCNKHVRPKTTHQRKLFTAFIEYLHFEYWCVIYETWVIEFLVSEEYLSQIYYAMSTTGWSTASTNFGNILTFQRKIGFWNLFDLTQTSGYEQQWSSNSVAWMYGFDETWKCPCESCDFWSYWLGGQMFPFERSKLSRSNPEMKQCVATTSMLSDRCLYMPWYWLLFAFFPKLSPSSWLFETSLNISIVQASFQP